MAGGPFLSWGPRGPAPSDGPLKPSITKALSHDVQGTRPQGSRACRGAGCENTPRPAGRRERARGAAGRGAARSCGSAPGVRGGCAGRAARPRRATRPPASYFARSRGAKMRRVPAADITTARRPRSPFPAWRGHRGSGRPVERPRAVAPATWFLLPSCPSPRSSFLRALSNFPSFLAVSWSPRSSVLQSPLLTPFFCVHPPACPVASVLPFLAPGRSRGFQPRTRRGGVGRPLAAPGGRLRRPGLGSGVRGAARPQRHGRGHDTRSEVYGKREGRPNEETWRPRLLQGEWAGEGAGEGADVVTSRGQKSLRLRTFLHRACTRTRWEACGRKWRARECVCVCQARGGELS